MVRSWQSLPLTLTLAAGPVLALAAAPMAAFTVALAPAVAQARTVAQSRTVAEPTVRVLLRESPEATLAAGGDAGLRWRDRQGRLLLETPGRQPLQLRLRGGWVEVRPASPTGAAAAARGPAEPLAGAAAGPGVRSASATPAPPAAGAAAAPLLAGPELWVEPIPAAGEASLTLQQRRYRGRLQLLVAGSNLQLINHLGVEAYLPSVVGSEMPASWPQEALRAQAVAARTYALRGRKPASAFDLKATVASQVYRGLEAETASTREAVAATRGLVLTYGSDLINAVFHSSSGGSTESSGDLWPQQLPYLVSVPDFDHDSPVRQWRQPLAPDLLARSFAEIGGVRSIEVLSTTPTGRVRQARVVGPAGALTLSGATLRTRLGLKSTWVRFELELPPAPAALNPPAPLAPPPLPAFSLPADAFAAAPQPPLTPLPLPQWVAVGRGFGHGIGMSQWGALAMARRGDSYTAILRHYYRGTQVRAFSELAVAARPGPGSGPAQLRDGDAQVVARGPRPQP